jgi:diguanylate cyclase (GGDEF)-like protein/PAS domain S-box-containing protein
MDARLSLEEPGLCCRYTRLSWFGEFKAGARRTPVGFGRSIAVMRTKRDSSAEAKRVPCVLARCCGLSLLLFPLLAFSQAGTRPPQRHTLRTVSSVFALSKTEALKAYPIELEGVVTYSDPAWGVLFMQDRTGPTFIDVHGIATVFPSGTRVRVEAVTGTNNDGPVVAHAKIIVLGHGDVPKPQRKSVAELDRGAGESYLTVTEGMLHPCERDYLRVCFRIYDGKRAAWLSVPQADCPAAQALIGAVVRARGVLGRHVNGADQRLGAQLYVSSLKDIEVEKAALPISFSSSPVPIGSLHPSDADQRFVNPIHLRGTVTWQSPGLFSIRDSTGTAFVEAWKDLSVRTGSAVDAMGFPRHGKFGLELADSAVRLVTVQPNSGSIAPLQLDTAEVVKHAVNGSRVHLKARLIGQSANATESVYTLESSGERFNAVLLRSDARRETIRFAPGSVLELTGLALIQSGNPEWPQSLLILIDSQAEMTVQETNSWLTLRTGLAIVGGIALCVMVPLIWVLLLRRTVRKQTGIIRTRLENEMHLEARFRQFVERSLAGVFGWRLDGTIVGCNPAFAKLLGFQSCEELIGRSYWDFQVDPAHREQLCRDLQGETLSNRNATLRRDDGSTVHLLMNITPVEGEKGTVYETTAIDVTQLRQNQAELQKAKDAAVYDSLYDSLTGLPNRRFLLDRLPFLLAKCRRDRGMIAVLYIDLDGFKLVNDSLGHPVGDALLVEIAGCLRARVREADILARLGGDEFMVILDGLHNREEAGLVAESLLDAISQPMTVEGHELNVGASIGISIFPESAGDAEELMRQSDSAMYAAKRDGKNRVMYFTSEIGFQLQERLSLENQLRGAIARHEIFVHYQPEFDIASNRLIRFEALTRWIHPTLGRIPPDKFIPIAEETGLISALGAYVMEQACTEALRWQSLTVTPVQVAVNVSSIQFRRKDFVEEVSAILDRTGLRPDLLQLELTESVMMSGSHCTAATMNRFRELGVGLAMDDFGTGYSSLSYLASLPFDALKIDRSFVTNLETQPESESMVRAMIVLAQNMGMRVIVEGVEKPEQLELIRAMGANEVQGYLMGRPSADPIGDILRGSKAPQSPDIPVTIAS